MTEAKSSPNIDHTFIRENTVGIEYTNNKGKEILHPKTCFKSYRSSYENANLDGTKVNNRKRQVTFSDEIKRLDSDDQGFCSAQEDVIITSVKYLETTLENSYKNNEVKAKSEDLHDLHLLKKLYSQNLDNASSRADKDTSKSTPAIPDLTVTCDCSHAVTIPLHEDTKNKSMHVVIPFIERKEKLTKRQLIQLSAMMALGFIFVVLILAWLISPTLF